MLTSKGTIQGYNGVATVDKKHQVIVDAQAFGEGQEHHTLVPVIESIRARYKKLGLNKNIFATQTVFTADTGFANEANMEYLHENHINAYVPDNQFRSRDPKFARQKEKYGKRHQDKVKGQKAVIPASEFAYDAVNNTCVCPAGKQLSPRGKVTDRYGKTFVRFEGRLSQCGACEQNHDCMSNPESAQHRKGHGRVVAFLQKKRVNYTDWMKHRIDSREGKTIYSHRMSVVEPVFGNITTTKKLNRFSLRGRQKVNLQYPIHSLRSRGRLWQLYCTIHNIEKLKNCGDIAGKAA